MINWKMLVPIPSKKIIEDLISREGEPTEASMCQLPGMYDLVRKYAGSEPIESVSLKILTKTDIRADKCSMRAQTRFFSLHGRKMKTIEDIPEATIRHYIGNLVYSATKHDTGSTKEDRKRFRYGRNFEDSDSDGFIIQESDLLTQKEDASTKDKLYWSKKLPYILKKLHQYSKTYEISIISAIVAYCRARRRYNLDNRNLEIVPIGKVVEGGIMKMNKLGLIKRAENGNILYENDGKGNFRKYVYDYIIGKKQGELYDLIHELLYICNSLQIDLIDEDATLYEEEFINNLITTYVTSNRVYLNMKCNPLSIKAIRSITFDRKDIKTEEPMTTKELLVKSIERQVSLIQNVEDSKIEKYRDVTGTNLKEYIEKMVDINYEFYGRFLNNIYFRDGFVCDANSKIILFPVSIFRRYNNDERFIIHKDGYVILINSLNLSIDTNIIVWYPIELMLQALEDIRSFCANRGIDLFNIEEHSEVYTYMRGKHYNKSTFGDMFETYV